MTITEFMEAVEVVDGCWLWTGTKAQPNGYARVGHEGRRIYVHRLAHELFKGPIPDDTTIDHLCRVRNCVNPSHIEAVPHKVNLRRAPGQVTTINATKTRCVRGHKFSGRDSRGWRYCRECIAMRKRNQRRLAEVAS